MTLDSLSATSKVREVIVSKKQEEDVISRDLQLIIEYNLGIKGIKGIKIFNNYLYDGVNDNEVKQAVGTIFSEGPVDDVYPKRKFSEYTNGKKVIVIESNPGQYDARVAAVNENLTLQTGRSHNSRYKKLVVIDGDISDEDLNKIKKMLINPVETFESDLKNRKFDRKITNPENHRVFNGFISLEKDEDFLKFLKEHELSINLDDIKLVHDYFKNTEKRDPKVAEILLIDTYWSDHCRHTTFNTQIENLEITGEAGLVEEVKSVNDFFKSESQKLGKNGNTFMEIAQASFRFLKNDPNFKGTEFIDVSIEDNAASYKTEIELEDGTKEKWIIMFKNETHNSPTEVEPFGGAATCLGGAIRDTLSGRAFTFAAMRISGSGNPTENISETLAGKLSQRAISIGAALGFSSYGNQIGLATGRVQEYFHPGYKAKRFECGYVLAAIKEENLKREKPKSGDLVIVFGGRTGRDGVGGANVSSQEGGAVSEHKTGSHVQKGNPVEERKFQRLLLNPEFVKLIKKSNDFGAGGVSVALGELSRGIDIDLNAIRSHTKYDGLSDEEMLIAESQERMSIVIAPEDYDKVMEFLKSENIEAFQAGVVTNNEENISEDRLKVSYEGQDVVSLSRYFLDSNGAQRKANAKIEMKPVTFFDNINPEVQKLLDDGKIDEAILKQLSLLGSASQRGLQSIFDASVGASTILAPFGGKYQDSPQIGMASKIPTFNGVDSRTAIISTNGFDPYLMEQNTFIGGIYSVIEAISRIVAIGGDYEKTWVSLQEYFGKLTSDEKYGEVYAGLLGTLKALVELKIAAIGGKDSMSGTSTLQNGNKISVPPTIVTFANTPVDSERVVSAEFKRAGNSVLRFHVDKDENGLPNWEGYRKNLEIVMKLIDQGVVLSSSVLDSSGLIGALSKMSLGNRIGVDIDGPIEKEDLFTANIGDIILEIDGFTTDPNVLELIEEFYIGSTKEATSTYDKSHIAFGYYGISSREAKAALEGTFEEVFSTKQVGGYVERVPEYSKRASLILNNPELLRQKPVALLPVFPGTNSELDTKHALIKAGFEVIEHVFYTPKLGVGNDQVEFTLARESRKEFADLLDKTSLLVFSGGFSGGDEPDGSAKFIANMMRSNEIKESLQGYLQRNDSLTLGICNGFQALIKLGVFNDGKVNNMLGENDPTLTFNDNLRHITGLVGLQVTSVLSLFARGMNLGYRFMVPVSHGEGRIIIPDQRTLDAFTANGQIPLQYVDEYGAATNKYNGSIKGIAGLTDTSGRIMGMMPHPERNGLNVFKNIPGEKSIQMIFNGAFESLRNLRK